MQDLTPYRTPEERFVGLPDLAFAPRYVEIDGMRVRRLTVVVRDWGGPLGLHLAARLPSGSRDSWC